MESEVKYYTPSLEEFCVGFEFEHLNYEGKLVSDPKWNKKEWHKEICDADWFNILLDDYEHDEEAVREYRVKYLDSSDIEEITKIHAKDYTTIFKFRNKYEDELVFATYWVEEKEYLDEEYIYWNTKYNTFNITHKSKTLFYGHIKNKSELKKVLQMIGII